MEPDAESQNEQQSVIETIASTALELPFNVATDAVLDRAAETELAAQILDEIGTVVGAVLEGM